MTKKETTQSKPKKEKKVHIRMGSLERREALAGLTFMIPWFIGAAVFLAYPLITSFWYALNNIRITPMGKTFRFLGYGNFTQILLSDQQFLPDLVDYVISTLISVPVIVVFALLIAMMLNQKIKLKGFFRLIFFLPVIIVSGPILGMLNGQNAGSISALDTQAITQAISSVLPAIVAKPIGDVFSNMVTILWYSGVQILIFLSALQKINSSMYEAARIDGASDWECFWKITLPTIKPMIVLNLVYTTVFISNNDQNAIIVLIKAAMFSGTSEKGYGYAAAMAWLYSLVVLLLVGLFAGVMLIRKDPYEQEVKKAKRDMKKEKRQLKRMRRRQARNAKKYAKLETKTVA